MLQYDALVVGGGFFGCILASELARAGRRTLLCEKETDFFQHASYVNQARVHNGYHYPRSVLTALRSRINFPKFTEEFSGCIVSDFEQIYAVPRAFSAVTSRQFRTFMERIGAPIHAPSLRLRKLFDPVHVEEVFAAVEFAFDALRLKELCISRMLEAGVEVRTDTKVVRLGSEKEGIRARCRSAGQEYDVVATEIFNCTYSQLNELMSASNLPQIKLKHELTELALIEPPEELERVGITMMCGPFFSTMPFPPRGLHTLSHVRYTPHYTWEDGSGPYASAHDRLQKTQKQTSFEHMVRDAARYMPCLKRAVYRDSLWTVKTVLPQSEADDSRPILFHRNKSLPGLICVMGGKIDNVYDALAELELNQ
jgi:glycine/D-amino acid oxidase-like deaminating enzyme